MGEIIINIDWLAIIAMGGAGIGIGSTFVYRGFILIHSPIKNNFFWFFLVSSILIILFMHFDLLSIGYMIEKNPFFPDASQSSDRPGESSSSNQAIIFGSIFGLLSIACFAYAYFTGGSGKGKKKRGGGVGDDNPRKPPRPDDSQDPMFGG